MAVHSNILAWENPRTEVPSWLHSTESQRAGCDLGTNRSGKGLRGGTLQPGVDSAWHWGLQWETQPLQGLTASLTQCDALKTSLPGSTWGKMGGTKMRQMRGLPLQKEFKTG